MKSKTVAALKGALLVIFLVVFAHSKAQTDDLMLVEYVDWNPGSGVAIKIYNPTSNTISLNGYTLEVYNNGSTSPTTTHNMTGSLASHQTRIYGNSPYCTTNCPSGCDETISNSGVNGNDVVVLRKSGNIVDMIGLLGYDPGNPGWKVDNTTNALLWHLVTRKADNCTRYTSTDGSSANSWPNNSSTNMGGWTALNYACINPGFTLNSSSVTPKIQIPSKDSSLCVSGTVNFTANGSYKWYSKNGSSTLVSSNSAGISLNFTTAGKDTIVIEGSSCGAPLYDTVVITTNPKPVVNLGNDTSLCNSDTLQLNATTPGATYLWQDNSTKAKFTAKAAGIYWVKVNNGCQATDSININYTQVNVSTGPDTTLCNTAAYTITAGGTPASYLWSDNSNGTSLTVNQTGTYWVKATKNNCSVVDSVNVAFTTLSVNIGPDTAICAGSNYTFDATTAGATYLWNTGNFSSTLTVNQAGTYWVRVSRNSCVAYDSANVSVNTAPLVNLGPDTTLCHNESITLNAPAANSRLWSTGSTGTSITASQSGIYWLKAGNNGCFATDSVNVTVLPAINKVLHDTTLCEGGTITLDATTAGASYTWNDSSHAAQKTVNKGGLYTVIINKGKCTLTDSAKVSLLPLPVLPGDIDTTLCEGLSLYFNRQTNAGTYSWSTGDTLPDITIKTSGIYTLTAKNHCGSSTTHISVSFKDCSEPFIPNVFTPNGDSLNDYFSIDFKSPRRFVIRIFNRWGEMLFESEHADFAWDGSFHGVEVPSGVYFVLINAVTASQRTFNYSGTLTLLR